jgi:hypothetical protein
VERHDLLEKRSNIKDDMLPRCRPDEIWSDNEEHKTVFSPSDVSEMKLRLEAGEPLRYIYG